MTAPSRMASRQRSRISPYFKCNRGGPPSADRMYSGERYWRVGAAAATELGLLLRSACSETGIKGSGGSSSWCRTGGDEELREADPSRSKSTMACGSVLLAAARNLSSFGPRRPLTKSDFVDSV